jgi:hypothetical protein
MPKLPDSLLSVPISLYLAGPGSAHCPRTHASIRHTIKPISGLATKEQHYPACQPCSQTPAVASTFQESLGPSERVRLPRVKKKALFKRIFLSQKDRE